MGPSADRYNSTRDKLHVPWAKLPENPFYLSLLTWRTRISEFAGRAKEMESLENWANSKPNISIKFITGAGGTGKTRLAAEFADALNKRKWAAGFVDLTKQTAYQSGKEGTLLVIDYPEANRTGVAELLQDLSRVGECKHRIRILFLTRQQIEDWEGFVRDNHAGHLVDKEYIEPAPLDSTSAHTLYLSALGEASEKLGTVPLPVSQAALTEWIGQAPENSRALFVVAAAVHSAIHPEDEVIRYSGREVIEELAQQERSRLRQIAEHRKARDPEVLAQLLAMAAIAGELSLARVNDLVNDTNLRLGFPQGANIRSELRAFGMLSGDGIPAPKPDIVAAAIVIQTFAESVETAPDLIWAALENDLEGALHRVARLSYDAEIVLGMRQCRIGTCLAKAVKDRADRCHLLEGFFMDTSPLGLLAAAVAVRQTLLRACSEDSTRAGLLNNLSNNLSEANDNPGALVAIQEAVEIYRRLAKADLPRYEPDLATSLNNLSNRLSDANDNPRALAAIQEAVEIYRRLAKADLPRYEPDLAGSLNNLSVFLSDANDNPGALAAIQEAVEIRRRLAKADSPRCESDLARSLNNLSRCLSDVNDNPGALVAVQEAVEIYRRLAEANPSRYEPDLAGSLNNISNRLSDANDNPGALAAIHEAVEIRRRLAKADPPRYEPDLAMSLNNLSRCLGHANDNPGALAAIHEAVEIYRRLAKVDSSRYEPYLATTLNNLSVFLSGANDNPGALAAIPEAVEIYRRLAKADPARYEPELATSLGMHGRVLRELGLLPQAIQSFREGAELIRPFALKSPQSEFSELLAAFESDIRKTQDWT